MSDTATAPFHGSIAAAGFAPTVVLSDNAFAPAQGSIACTGFAPKVIEASAWTSSSAASTTWSPVEF